MTALSVFRAVVALGSFSQAARQLGLSPAAISKNVTELEAHLGTRLLNRTTRRMSLTEAGTTYYERVSRVLDDLADADAAVGSVAQVPRGTLRVSAPVSVTLVAIASALPRFLAANPAVSLDLHTDDRRVDLVRDGFDLAVRGTDVLEDSGMVTRTLCVLKHVLCAAPSYFERAGTPRRPEELRDHACVRFSLSGHADLWTFERAGEVVPVPVHGRYRVSSSLAVREALLAGFGLSLIPELYVRDALASGALVPALQDWSADETTLYAVYPSRQFVPAKTRAFIDFLLDAFTSA
jgi:DNA-binding transcriptional LysR family regulator